MRVLAIEHALPSHRITNEELTEWVLARQGNGSNGARRRLLRAALRSLFERTGAETRYLRAPGERALDFGVAAGRRALTRAGVGPDDIDLLIYVGVGRGFVEPASANVFHRALGLRNATCFDVLDACASWLRAFDLAHHYLRAGTYRRAMILNCEFNFAEYVRLDIETPRDLDYLWAGLTVGEAATATIVEAEPESNGYHTAFRTSGDRYDLCQIPLPHADQFQVHPNGRTHRALGFFAYARQLQRAGIEQLVEQYWSDPDLPSYRSDIIFGHAVSVNASSEVLARLELERERFVEIFPEYGNTVSATVPLAMSVAAADGRLRRGQRVLIVMASAGLTTGFCRFQY